MPCAAITKRVQLEDARLDSGSDVEDTCARGRGNDEQRLDYVPERSVDVREPADDVARPVQPVPVAKYSSPASLEVPYGDSGVRSSSSPAGRSHSP
jgi:hypothetical protein